MIPIQNLGAPVLPDTPMHESSLIQRPIFHTKLSDTVQSHHFHGDMSSVVVYLWLDRSTAFHKSLQRSSAATTWKRANHHHHHQSSYGSLSLVVVELSHSYRTGKRAMMCNVIDVVHSCSFHSTWTSLNLFANMFHSVLLMDWSKRLRSNWQRERESEKQYHHGYQNNPRLLVYKM